MATEWLNEGRCPVGRPSVSTNEITIEASVFCIEMTTVHAIYEHRIKLVVPHNPKIAGVGRRHSESLEQGLVAPPRARMTNNRSTGVA